MREFSVKLLEDAAVGSAKHAALRYSLTDTAARIHNSVGILAACVVSFACVATDSVLQEYRSVGLLLYPSVVLATAVAGSVAGLVERQPSGFAGGVFDGR